MSVTWQERTAAGAWEERGGAAVAVLLAPGPDSPRAFRDPWPFPDLALLRVSGADDVRCLWLSDREPGARAPVGLYGWSVQTGELGIRHGTGELSGSDARALLLGGSLPIGGLSGGPVLDLRHGSVIGVIKGRRREEGVAVPVTALHELLDLREGARVLREVLRAHDRHHLSLLDDPSPYANWTSIQTALPCHVPAVSGITAGLRARLYGHLAELPPPAGAGEVVHLVDEVKEQVRGERLRSLVLQDVRTWREGAGLLYGLRTLDPGGGGTLVDLDAVLLYAAKVLRASLRVRPGQTDPERLRAFADWITGQADGHRHWAVGEAIRGLLEGLGDGRPGETGPPPGSGHDGGHDDGYRDGHGHGRRDGGVGGLPSPREPETPVPARPLSTLPAPTLPAPTPASTLPAPATPVPAPPDPAVPAPATAVPAPVSLGSGPAGTPVLAPAVAIPAPAPPAEAPVAASATRTDVLVKIGAPMYDGRYPWRVQLIYDGQDVTPVDGDDRGVRAEELAGALREPLARALSLGDHGEHLAAIEVFLPRRLFDLPVDEWQLVPDTTTGTTTGAASASPCGPPCAAGDEDDEDDDFVDERSMPLGLRRTVVIRDVRRSDRSPSPEWRRRWHGVCKGPLAHAALHGRSPEEGHPAGPRPTGTYPYYGALTALDDTCVPVYCGPAGSGEGQAAMRDALTAGHSVVLWRRDRHDHDECADFHRQAAALLAAARHADGLHGPVRDLRIRLADPGTAHAQGLRGKLAVLFDPPDRPSYGTEAMRPPPLAAPGG